MLCEESIIKFSYTPPNHFILRLSFSLKIGENKTRQRAPSPQVPLSSGEQKNFKKVLKHSFNHFLPTRYFLISLKYSLLRRK